VCASTVSQSFDSCHIHLGHLDETPTFPCIRDYLINTTRHDHASLRGAHHSVILDLKRNILQSPYIRRLVQQ